MTKIERNGEGFVVPVELLADAFGLTEARVREGMRTNRITSMSETGVGEDEGHWKVTFFHQDRAYRFTVDDRGQILKRVGFPVGRKFQSNLQTEPVSEGE